MDEFNEINKKFRKELSAGTTALVLLSIMSKAEEPMYGYRIAKELETQTEKLLMMKQGALYPVLRSLENYHLLESHVDPSVSGPPRKYYRITDEGRQILMGWIEIWRETRIFIDNILGGDEDDN